MAGVREYSHEQTMMQPVVFTVDSDFGSETGETDVLDTGVDAYIADPHFRKRGSTSPPVSSS